MMTVKWLIWCQVTDRHHLVTWEDLLLKPMLQQGYLNEKKEHWEAGYLTNPQQCRASTNQSGHSIYRPCPLNSLSVTSCWPLVSCHLYLVLHVCMRQEGMCIWFWIAYFDCTVQYRRVGVGSDCWGHGFTVRPAHILAVWDLRHVT